MDDQKTPEQLDNPKTGSDVGQSAGAPATVQTDPGSSSPGRGESAEEQRPEQQVTVEDSGPARKKLTIELPPSRVKEKIESKYGTLRHDAAIPGFRRGRAPRRLIERRFGGAVRDEAKGELISESFRQAVEDEDLDVVGEPDVDVEKIELPASDSASMTFTLEVEVAPKVELPSFSELEVTRPSAQVSDADVDQQIEQYKHQLGSMVEASADSEIQEEDYLLCDLRILAGEDAGDQAEQIAHHPAQNVLVHGEGYDYRGHVAGILVEDMGKRLLGGKVGQEVSISMTGPAGHADERIQGQPITLKLNIERIQRLEPVSMEQVVERVGAESEEGLRQQLRPMLEEQARQRQTSQMHEQVTGQLLEKVEMELPEGLTAAQTERLARRQAMEMAYRGATREQVDQRMAEGRTESDQEARRQLKQFFILNEAAEKLGVEVGDEEMHQRVAMMAMQQGRRPEKLLQEMRQRGELNQVYLQLREHKALDQIIEQAKVTDASETPASDEADNEGEEAAQGQGTGE